MPDDISDVLRDDNTPAPERDPKTRYIGGFDRWDYDALASRAICCSVSNCMTVSLDHRGDFWWWSYDEQIWWQHDAISRKLVKGESDLFVSRIATALPLIRKFSDSPPGPEKDATYAALSELALGVNGAFRRSPDDGGVVITAFDLYSGATRDHSWQILDLHPPAYDEAVAADLRERDQELRKALVTESLAMSKARKPLGAALGDKLRDLELERAEQDLRNKKREATRQYLDDVKRQTIEVPSKPVGFHQNSLFPTNTKVPGDLVRIAIYLTPSPIGPELSA